MGPEGTTPKVHARHACNKLHPKQASRIEAGLTCQSPDELNDGAPLESPFARSNVRLFYNKGQSVNGPSCGTRKARDQIKNSHSSHHLLSRLSK